MSHRKTVLVLYYSRGVYPLRDAIYRHLYCWRRYGRHRVSYINVAFGFPIDLVRRLNPDVVIFHTIFLSMRWSEAVFRKYTALCAFLENYQCWKIALPQDEFIHTDLLAEYLGRIKITHIGTCAYESDWRTIYRKLWDTHADPESVVFKTVLTGYLDEDTIARIEKMKRKPPPRDIDIGYRAWRAQYWLGEHGMHKVRVADRFEEAGRAANLRCDISMRDEDVLAGDDWFRFLLRCRATVGVEGGASLCDHDGSIKRLVESYLSEHPDASFDQVRAACFPDRDNTLNLACVSPRHLEACVTETCQALIEGRYSDILVSGRDYIPVRKDYSNISEAIAALQDPVKTRQITISAYEHVVRSGRWTYAGFVREMETEIIDPAPPAPIQGSWAASWWASVWLNIRDWLLWRFIHLEVAGLRARPSPFRHALGAAYRLLMARFELPVP